MDNQPKTRKEAKKPSHEKKHGNGFGSQKHVRNAERIRENKTQNTNTSVSSGSKTPPKK